MTLMSKLETKHAVALPAAGLVGSGNVRTPCGPRRVENIRKGDLIVTRDNGLQPVRMVWSRTLTAAELSADPGLAPIRFRPRALGPMMPQQDLVVGPDHRVFVPGYRLADMPDTTSRLIAARAIADGSDAAFADRSDGETAFYNIVFDQHQVFCVNGLPVESYLPSIHALRALDQTISGDLAKIFPDLGTSKRAYPVSPYITSDDPNYSPEFV
ncbi:MAG: Hint domain-containing protein [Pseudomonadota bacterium]